MQGLVVLRILGLLLSIFSVTMLIPGVISLFYKDGSAQSFFIGFAVTLVIGLSTWFPLRNYNRPLKLRDGFVVVVLFWAVLGLFGAIPLYIDELLNLTIAQSIFESLSGFTTTGATVIVGLDTLPQGILMYRQLMQWLGGMGIIVLAVAILPLLGIGGGMQLFRAETPGPQKEKMTPRVADTAKRLWYIYLGLTVACAVAYALAGMPLFDAIGHSFSTVAIGGFSTHDASIGFYESSLIEMIAVVFMLISGVNFALHYLAFRSRSLTSYLEDSEFRFFISLLVLLSVITVAYLYATQTAGFSQSFFTGIFQVVSIATTTGFTTAEYFNWPGFLPVLLLFASFVGGCAGSTGGGMKVIRVLLLLKQGLRELSRMVHPHAMLPVKVGKKTIPPRVIDAVWGFFSTYVLILALMLLVLMATGLDQETAFSAVVACLNNLGPGLGDVGANYSSLGGVQLSLLCVAMLLGRLEIFTLLVLLTPGFWRK
ncbi:MAG: TrkH family potassium uptake protein [Pseudomonadota bacterium]